MRLEVGDLPCGGFLVAAEVDGALAGFIRVEKHFGHAVCVLVESDGTHGLFLRLLRRAMVELRARGFSSVLAHVPRHSDSPLSGIPLRRLYSRLGFTCEAWVMQKEV